MLWSRIRDGVLARTHQLGRQVALRLVAALQRAVARDERVRVVGTWREVFAALGLEEPSDKAARKALSMLESVAAGAVQCVGYKGGWLWQVVSHAADVCDVEQLELQWDSLNGKAESGPTRSVPASQPAAPPARARAGALARSPSSPSPRSVAAQALAARVADTGAVEQGRAWAVTLTAGDDADLERLGGAFVNALRGECCGAVLVPEVSRRLHWHGVAIGEEADVQRAVQASGAGRAVITGIYDVRGWADYAVKAPAGEQLASGVLAERSESDGGDQGAGVGRVRVGGVGGDEPPSTTDGRHGAEADGGVGLLAGRDGGRSARGAGALRRALGALGAAWGWVRRRLGR